MSETKPTSTLLHQEARRHCCDHNVPNGPEDGESVCCICTRRPCERITLNMVMDHAFYQQWAASVGRDEAILFAIEHGHRPDPWGECPSTCRKGSS